MTSMIICSLTHAYFDVSDFSGITTTPLPTTSSWLPAQRRGAHLGGGEAAVAASTVAAIRACLSKEHRTALVQPCTRMQRCMCRGVFRRVWRRGKTLSFGTGTVRPVCTGERRPKAGRANVVLVCCSWLPVVGWVFLVVGSFISWIFFNSGWIFL